MKKFRDFLVRLLGHDPVESAHLLHKIETLEVNNQHLRGRLEHLLTRDTPPEKIRVVRLTDQAYQNVRAKFPGLTCSSTTSPHQLGWLAGVHAVLLAIRDDYVHDAV